MGKEGVLHSRTDGVWQDQRYHLAVHTSDTFSFLLVAVLLCW
jgi:hypothetical protein